MTYFRTISTVFSVDDFGTSRNSMVLDASQNIVGLPKMALRETNITPEN